MTDPIYRPSFDTRETLPYTCLACGATVELRDTHTAWHRQVIVSPTDPTLCLACGEELVEDRCLSCTERERQAAERDGEAWPPVASSLAELIESRTAQATTSDPADRMRHPEQES